jgi:hypothetical protein
VIENINNTYLIIFHFKPFMRFEYPYIIPQMELKYKNDIENYKYCLHLQLWKPLVHSNCIGWS